MENLYLMGFIGLIGVGLGAWGHETLKKSGLRAKFYIMQ
jgi:hypothetical protein